MPANLIVQFLNGNNDAPIVRGTNSISAKRAAEGACPIINVPYADRDERKVIAALSDALRDAGKATRIYLRGHGNWEEFLLGGWRPMQVAKLLKLNGLHSARVISITGCNAARAPQVGEPESLSEMTFQERKALAERQLSLTRGSFAGIFHRTLGEPHPAPAIQNIPVTARMYPVDVDESGHKTVRIGGHATAKSGIGSAYWGKVIYKWQAGDQVASWIHPQHDEY